MPKSVESRINWIREQLYSVALYLNKSQGETKGKRYSDNLHNMIVMEDVIVEFERLVNGMPLEDR